MRKYLSFNFTFLAKIGVLAAGLFCFIIPFLDDYESPKNFGQFSTYLFYQYFIGWSIAFFGLVFINITAFVEIVKPTSNSVYRERAWWKSVLVVFFTLLIIITSGGYFSLTQLPLNIFSTKTHFVWSTLTTLIATGLALAAIYKISPRELIIVLLVYFSYFTGALFSISFLKRAYLKKSLDIFVENNDLWWVVILTFFGMLFSFIVLGFSRSEVEDILFQANKAKTFKKKSDTKKTNLKNIPLSQELLDALALLKDDKSKDGKDGKGDGKGGGAPLVTIPLEKILTMEQQLKSSIEHQLKNALSVKVEERVKEEVEKMQKLHAEQIKQLIESRERPRHRETAETPPSTPKAE